jgi:hypothetical protein
MHCTVHPTLHCTVHRVHCTPSETLEKAGRRDDVRSMDDRLTRSFIGEHDLEQRDALLEPCGQRARELGRGVHEVVHRAAQRGGRDEKTRPVDLLQPEAETSAHHAPRERRGGPR